jgi:hypothetical protein
VVDPIERDLLLMPRSTTQQTLALTLLAASGSTSSTRLIRSSDSVFNCCR